MPTDTPIRRTNDPVEYRLNMAQFGADGFLEFHPTYRQNTKSVIFAKLPRWYTTSRPLHDKSTPSQRVVYNDTY